VSARRLAAAALVAALATVGLVARPAAAAPVEPTITVAPDGGGVVRPDRGLGVGVTVKNPGGTALPAGRLTFSLDTAPVANSTALLTAIAKPPDQLQGKLAHAAAAVPAIAPGTSQDARATISAKDLRELLNSTSGARLLYVQYKPNGGASKLAVSSIVKMATGLSASVGLGVVIPVVAPAGATGVVDTAAQAELTGPGGAWTEALRAADAFPAATIALDPEVIASIRLAGDGAPGDALAFLDALGRLPNETVRLPYADTDTALVRAAGQTRSVEPSSFAGVTLAPAEPTGATPAPTPSTPPPATSAADLTAWNWSDRSLAWPVPHTASAADVSAAGAKGDVVLLPSDDVKDTPARRAAGPLAAVRSAKVLISDETTSALLTAAGADGPGGDAALATLSGVLATAAVTGETTALVATVARTADAARLDRVLSTIGRAPWVRGRTLPQLTSGPATQVSLRPSSVPAARIGVAHALLAGEHHVQELGTAITSGRDTVTAPQRLALLGTLSASWQNDDTGWRAAADTTEAAFSKLVGLVRLGRQSDPNLVGSDGTLPVVVVNGLPTPIEVVVHGGVSNGALQFTGNSAVTVQVPAGGRNTGLLHFRSIRNGQTDLTLSLTTKNGAALGGQVARGATVRAGFDTIIAAALLTALGLLLALGVYRNVTRRRRPRTAVA
jgi:hypothetical protein